jgi:hypothetical protein
VAGWILNSRAASAAVLSPLDTIRLISACCSVWAGARRCVLPDGGIQTAFVLSRSIARSNSAKAPYHLYHHSSRRRVRAACPRSPDAPARVANQEKNSAFRQAKSMSTVDNYC